MTKSYIDGGKPQARMKRDRISYISGSVIPSRAANSVHVMKMCQAFSANGNQVRLYARRGEGLQPSIFEEYGVSEIFELRMRSYPSIPVLGALHYSTEVVLDVLRTSDPGLIYGRYLHPLVLFALLGKRVIYEAHSLPPKGAHRTMQKWLFSQPGFRRLVVISEALKQDYFDAFPSLTPEKVVVAHDGADPMATGLAEDREEHCRGLKNFRVGYVGQLYEGKGLEIVVELARRNDWAEFHVVGGMADDIALWKDRGAELPNLIFHGYVSPAAAERFRASFDVLLAPYQHNVSVHGGGGNVARWMSPLKVFEYMAAGKGIICSDLPVLREVLEHEQDALLCAPDSVDAWEQALRRLYEDPDLRARLGARAQKKFLGQYTWQGRARRVLADLDLSSRG